MRLLSAYDRICILAKFCGKPQSEITSQLNSVLTHRAKLYSPQLPAGNLACVANLARVSEFSFICSRKRI